jgi:hypothetical protein
MLRNCTIWVVRTAEGCCAGSKGLLRNQASTSLRCVLPAQAAAVALSEAVGRLTSLQPDTYSDGCVAVVHMLAVVKEGLYVKVLKRLHFNYRQQGLPYNTGSTAAAAAHR